MRLFFRRALLIYLWIALPVVHGAPLPQGRSTEDEVLTAEAIPSLAGFVRSPYTNPPKLVNVQDAAPGSTVVCPYTQRPFIVPAWTEAPKKAPAHTAAPAKPRPTIPPPSAPVREAAVVIPTEDSAWRLTIGPQWRQLGIVDWQTGSAAAGRPLPWLAGRGTNSGGSSGIPQGTGDHEYEDGYVNADAGTAAFGNTWYWGYDNASQLQGNDLVFHGSSSASSYRSSSWSSVQRSSWSEELQGVGVFAKFESPDLVKVGAFALSVELAYSWTHDETARTTRDVFRAEQRSTSYTENLAIEDRYDVTGLLVPGAPYAGSYAGPGLTIPNTPYSRTESGDAGSSAVQAAVFSSDVRETFEVNLHTLSFGPRLSSTPGKNVRLGVSTGLALNFVDWKASHEETLSVRQNGGPPRTLKQWRTEESGTEVLAGLYVEAVCEIRLTNRLSAYAGGRYDWSDGMSAKVGPSRVKFEPGGWTATVGLTISL